MKFYELETGKIRKFGIRMWAGSHYLPDMFDDLEVYFPSNHVRLEGTADTYKATMEELNILRAKWKDFAETAVCEIIFEEEEEE